MPSFTQVSQQAGAAAGGVKRRVRQLVCVCQGAQVCLQEDYYQMLHDGRMQMGRNVPGR